jgi:putative Holliday junction resolvase
MTVPRTGRLLGIDHGIKRIGLAVCDGSQMIARELKVIVRASKQEDFARINTVLNEQQIVGIVIGLPYNDDSPTDAHTQADTVKLWAERLGATTALPIVFWDEQLTSEDAKLLARQQKRKREDPIDDLAARLILQSYLDAVHDGLVDNPSD